MGRHLYLGLGEPRGIMGIIGMTPKPMAGDLHSRELGEITRFDITETASCDEFELHPPCYSPFSVAN